MAGVLNLVRTLGPARLGAMGAVAAILIGFFAFIVSRLSAMPMAPLYSDLTIEDASAIVSRLESAGVPYELSSGGSTVLAPRDQVLRLRMQLAEDGMPSGGSIGYEIFDQTSTLGTTSFVQNINHLRALEGELARSIRTIDRIVSARVHLVIPERQLFQREAAEPSAAIVLNVRGTLEAGQIRAIQHLVASSVEGLKPSRVSMVDENGQLLASGSDDDSVGLLATGLAERTSAYENRVGRQLNEIVSSVVGPGRARVQVTAEFDLNRITETRDVFDPESQVVRSQQSRSEESQSGTPQENGVSVSNSLPGAGAADQGGAGGEKSSTTDETVNYEISRTTTTEVTEPGRLKRVSVAILVDGIYTPDAAGALQYAPRPQEELDRIANLVKSAVGFDQARGDKVEVVNLRFAEAPRIGEVETADAGGLGLEKADYFYLAELALAVVLGLLVIFMVVRPLIRRIVTPDEAAAAALAAPGMPGAPPALTDQSGGGSEALPAGQTASQIERAKLSGALQADTIGQVGQIARDNPRDAVAIVRSWLREAA